jgi:hypothetical protein
MNKIIYFKMKYKCSQCNYISNQRSNIISHINKKKKCSEGIKEILEVPYNINCEFCKGKFSCDKSLKRHIKNGCTQQVLIKEAKIKELEEKVKELERSQIKNTNIIIHNRKTDNIVVVNYEDTKLDHIKDNIYDQIIKNEETYQIIPKFIKYVHFNSEIPENHNISISNRNKHNKHMNIFKNGQWEIIDKNTEIDNIINDRETNINDWICKKKDEYPEAAEIFNDYLEQKDDEDTAKLIKEEVELVLYNNRNLVKKNKKKNR